MAAPMLSGSDWSTNITTGPGAPDLITMRADRLPGEADIVVHEATIPEPVIALARRDAERVRVSPGPRGRLAALPRPRRPSGHPAIQRGWSWSLDRRSPHLAAAGVPIFFVPGVAPSCLAIS